MLLGADLLNHINLDSF